MYLISILIIAAVLAFIPANIAKSKGYSFGGWWLYGFLLWLVTFIHSLCLKDKAEENMQYKINEKMIKQTDALSKPDVLLKYKELCDKGVITKEEFENKKKEILN